MRLLLFLFLFQYTQPFHIPSHSAAPTTGVTYGNNGCSASASGPSTLSCTISGVIAGQTILVDFGNFEASTSVLTDSNTGSISTIIGPTVMTVYTGSSDTVWVIKNVGAGTHVLTVTASGGSSYAGITAETFTGASTTSPIDAVSVGPNIYYSATTCPAVTTSAAGELLFSFVNIPGGGTSTPGTVPQVMTAGVTPEDAYGVAASAGSNYVSWAITGNSWICDTIALH